MPQGPTFTCLPWFQSWIVFYSLLSTTSSNIPTCIHPPFAFSFHRDHTFSFQCVTRHHLNEAAADSITSYAEPSSARLILVCGVDGLCGHFHFLLLSDQHAKWDRLKKQPAVTGRVTPDALLTPWQLFAAHLAGKFVQRASVIPTVYIALGVIAVNPVISTGVCAFRRGENCIGKTGREQLNTYRWTIEEKLEAGAKVGQRVFRGPQEAEEWEQVENSTDGCLWESLTASVLHADAQMTGYPEYYKTNTSLQNTPIN